MHRKHQRYLVLIALLLGSLGLTNVQAATVGSLNNYNLEKPMIISHRGSPLNYPEHSFAGYNFAIKNGSKFIEQDIILSKDNQLVVSHDNNLKKNTSKNITITGSTYKQIKKAKLKNGEKLHTLKDVMGRYKNKINYVIETKKTAKGGYKLEKGIIAVIKKHKLQSNVILQSFSLASLNYMHKKLPKAPEMLLVNGANSNYTYLEKRLKTLPRAVNIVAVYTPGVTSENAKLIHKYHRKAVGYVLDGHAAYVNEILSDFDGLFTDDTKQAVSYFGE
ncbi:glycerophosphoryl diester phosphodiesterase [Secundilactobacillus oryzae JCM 18671]|uniref:Glycerophosphoryl diester phosphodiesterase n=1 Tax=Secundilactobacillus oryzae JCM 18671 TaxID=1291743 RepID=A0A081BHK5_9LACO|nr:glycerophosphodiester phosphodiesterase family protein [Secundilactobacillus oryzae]GAK47523.1 glycerophosphoryl diester phosphodiesterase [Secundilactobacillus oryzae JCM 18671]